MDSVRIETGDQAVSAEPEAQALLDGFISVYIHDYGTTSGGTLNPTAQRMEDLIVPTQEVASVLRDLRLLRLQARIRYAQPSSNHQWM